MTIIRSTLQTTKIITAHYYTLASDAGDFTLEFTSAQRVRFYIPQAVPNITVGTCIPIIAAAGVRIFIDPSFGTVVLRSKGTSQTVVDSYPGRMIWLRKEAANTWFVLGDTTAVNNMTQD